jgi:hypothetical protein
VMPKKKKGKKERRLKEYIKWQEIKKNKRK